MKKISQSHEIVKFCFHADEHRYKLMSIDFIIFIFKINRQTLHEKTFKHKKSHKELNLCDFDALHLYI